MQLIPIGDSIVYVRPIYVEGQGEGQFPRLRFVALTYGNNAVLVDFEGGEGDLTTVQQGVAGAAVGEPDESRGTGEAARNRRSIPRNRRRPRRTVAPPTGSVAQLLQQAADALDQAEAARTPAAISASTSGW